MPITTILFREVKSFFNSMLGFVILVIFLTSIGLILWVFPDSNVLDYGFADLNSFFALCPLVLLFFVPAVTMKSFSEEIKQGTLEMLLTKPVSIIHLIFGKYFASICIILLSFLPTLIYYFSVREIGSPKNNIDSAAVAGSYFGLTLLSGVFAAIGLFFSSISSNQMIAFVLSVFVSFILYIGLGQLSSLFESGVFKQTLNFMSLEYQYQALGRGLIDSRNITYMISIISIFFYITYQNLRKGQ